MNCPRIKRFKWFVLGVALLPPLLWALVLVLMPTEWARLRIEQAMRAMTGHEVRLQGVSLCLLGELRVTGLEVTQPGGTEGPWLHADEVQIGVGPISLMMRKGTPTHIIARGVILNLHREPGGSFEFSSLLRTRDPNARPDPDAESADPNALTPQIAFKFSDSRITVLDEPTRTTLELTALEGTGTWRRHQTTLNRVTGKLNGGDFELDADLVRGAHGPMFESELKARQVQISRSSSLVGYLAPVLARPTTEAGLDGTMDLNLYLRAQGDTADELRRTVVGRGAIRVDAVTVADGSPLAELTRALNLPENTRVGTVRGEFQIGQGQIASHPLVLEIGNVPLVLDGATDFRGVYDYRLRSEALAGLISKDLRLLIPELPMTVEDFLDVRIQGGEGPLRLNVNGIPIGTDAAGRPLSSRERLKDVSRRIRDRLLR